MECNMFHRKYDFVHVFMVNTVGCLTQGLTPGQKSMSSNPEGQKKGCSLIRFPLPKI